MKLGIVGNGMIVHTALDALQHVSDITLEAICVRPNSLEKGLQLKDDYSINKVFTSYEEFLNDADIDFAYIGIINSLHFDYAYQALMAGKNVILEKPMCPDYDSTYKLSCLALEKNLFLFEAVTFLHASFFKEIQSLLPRIGNVKLVQCNFSKYSSRYSDYIKGIVHPVFDPQQYGGTLLDINVYNINFVAALLGLPRQVHYYANHGANGVDTSGILLLEYDGFIASCASAKDSSSPGFMMIQGDKGYMAVYGNPNHLEMLEVSLEDTFYKKDLRDTKNRMIDEFEDFLHIYQQRDWQKMKHYLDISIMVSQIISDARQGNILPHC